MTNTVPDEKRAALVAGLRELADWLEQHPTAPTSFGSILNSLSADDLAAFTAAAGVEAKPTTLSGEPRPYSFDADLRFGPIKLHTYHLVRDLYEERIARTRETEKYLSAAAWILVCDAGHLPTSTTYDTEQAAKAVLAMHTTACTGGHTVHLVSPAPSVELVQA
jgi:hypothetical protein